MQDQDLSIEFSRFPAEKQEQIRQLVAYTTLMGLTGKDLVSIGGKLDRVQQRREVDQNRAAIKNLIDTKKILRVGKDKNLSQRWAYDSGAGWYYFVRLSYNVVEVIGANTKEARQMTLTQNYKFGRYKIDGSRLLPIAMMHVLDGNFLLNF